ncbi:MAG: D-alanyl-D-alanine carboxypeptidase/D-alanyl-D-alanine-endopeptidase [Acidobacteriota bacterium]|nr:D-alanyl-D-alanine carboxypeptidase/D-alanyl-D-alanine-endopeptidase [Acidobacteriota bacterium]
MTKFPGAAAIACIIAISACAARPAPPTQPTQPAQLLVSDLDRLFSTPPFDTALWSVRIERMRDGRLLYERNARTLVMPASNMKIVTMAAAAEMLGWDYRFETRLAARGEIRDGVLHGDLIAIGGGDPSIASVDFGASPLFTAWARELRAAGVSRVTGRVIGDDSAFDDEGIGAGWAWDYLAYGYAAPVSALQYSESVAVLRIRPGTREGEAATVVASPPGHGLDIRAAVQTTAATTTASIDLARLPGQNALTVTGRVPANGRQVIRTAAVDNPTLFFAAGLRDALMAAGIRVDGAAMDIDQVDGYVVSAQDRLLAMHRSAPLSELGAYFMKVSQNVYGETFLKAMGRTAGGGAGSLATGRAVVRGLLEKWGIAPGTYAIFDGSGLSRYNEISAALVVTVLRRMHEDEKHRGWFMAALPVAGQDGTLDQRMIGTELARAVQAKTGTISNARSLSGFLTAPDGERFVFSIIANNFQRPSAEVDAIAEGALKRVLREASLPSTPAPRQPSR